MSQELKSGDILHFKTKGIKKIFKGLNPIQSGIYLKIWGFGFAFILVNNRVEMIKFSEFCEKFSFISSSPLWIKSPLSDVLRKYGEKYKNSDIFIGEILGARDFETFKDRDVLKHCIKHEWLSE